MPDNVVLVGFMGAGKSEVARALSARLGYELRDTDEMIAAAAGCTISEIFEAEGEQGFRRRESAAVREAAAGTRRVIACGGGAVVDPANRALLRAAGLVVYLRASPAELRARVGAGAGRPMLERRDFDELLTERGPAYEAAADRVVDTDGCTPGEVAEEIERLLP